MPTVGTSNSLAQLDYMFPEAEAYRLGPIIAGVTLPPSAVPH